MRRRNATCFLVIAMVLAACGSGGSATPASTQSASVAPASPPPAASGTGATVTISTAEWVASFTVSSCTSPGARIVNIQASGPDGDLDLRASGEGRFRIRGDDSRDAQIDEILVADDGSVTASGTVAPTDSPELASPFILVATPGTCT